MLKTISSIDAAPMMLANTILSNHSTLAERSVTFRSVVCPDDEAFLAELYASTCEMEMAVVPWSQAEKASFLQRQFRAQHTYYREHFPDAEFLVVLQGEQAIGRLYLERRDDEIRIIDVALLPSHRGQGIGTALVQGIVAQGDREGLAVRIHVEQYNPAMRLYRRLGFRHIGDEGVYALMEWVPGTAVMSS